MITEKHLSIKIELTNEEIETLKKAKEIIAHLDDIAVENKATIFNYYSYDDELSQSTNYLEEIETDLDSIINITEME